MKRIMFAVLLAVISVCSYSQNHTSYRELPCTMYDTDEYFTGTGVAHGLRDSIASLNILALKNAQMQVYMKAGHTAKVLKEGYESWTDKGNDEIDGVTKTEYAIQSVYNVEIGETEEFCRQISVVDENGEVDVYVGIRVKKKTIITKE